MLVKEASTVYSERDKNPYIQNEGLLTVEEGREYIYNWPLKGQTLPVSLN
jgi:hypothetical protein